MRLVFKSKVVENFMQVKSIAFDNYKFFMEPFTEVC